MTGREGGRLAGEIALVAPSATGVGREVARCFAAEGAVVAVTGPDTAAGAAVVAAIVETGGTAVFRPAELADEGECGDLVSWVVEELGGLTVLVTVAAEPAAHDAAIHDLDPGTWERILGGDLTTAAWLCREAIAPMLDAEHGAIVNIAPAGARTGGPAQAARAASAGGLEALTRSIAVDYRAQGIRANSISPGPLVVPTDDDRTVAPAPVPSPAGPDGGDGGDAWDIARASLFLASREARRITGVNLTVDGGASIGTHG